MQTSPFHIKMRFTSFANKSVSYENEIYDFCKQARFVWTCDLGDMQTNPFRIQIWFTSSATKTNNHEQHTHINRHTYRRTCSYTHTHQCTKSILPQKRNTVNRVSDFISKRQPAKERKNADPKRNSDRHESSIEWFLPCNATQWSHFNAARNCKRDVIFVWFKLFGTASPLKCVRCVAS